MSTPVCIHNCVVRQLVAGVTKVQSIRSYKKQKPDKNVDTFPILTLGHKELDKLLLYKILTGEIKFDELLSPKPETLHYHTRRNLQPKMIIRGSP